jgi:nucleotide-binding universal stress UspA family protein
MHLVRKCPCPVWVVRPIQPERHTKTLAAVDPTPLDEERSNVNIRIMDLATAPAHRQRCGLAIVHTWTFPAERALRSGSLVALREVEGWVHDAQDLHRLRLAELLRPYPLRDLESQVFMLKGEPGRMIPEIVAKLDVGLIVMGSLRRAVVAGLLIGGTAERALRQVDCAALTVKPDGFVTPVTLDG